VVVAAGAAGTFGRFDETTPDDFDRCTAVTYTGAVNTIRSALPHLERSGGRRSVLAAVRLRGSRSDSRLDAR
jgi:NAD(P)-dependent dehydrogenase (short-subunit alcohol dehydrogenase family)